MEKANMCAKYQLVFAMMESYLGKIIASNRIYERWVKGKALSNWKNITEIEMINAKVKSSVALHNIKSALKKCLRIYTLHFISLKGKYMMKWIHSKKVIKMYEVEDKKYKDSNYLLLKSIAEKESAIQTSTNKNQTLSKQINELNGYIKKLEEDVRNVKDKVKVTNESFNKLNNEETSINLRKRIISLENENMELKAKIDATELNLNGFIQEMNQTIADTQSSEDQIPVSNAKAKNKVIAKHY